MIDRSPSIPSWLFALCLVASPAWAEAQSTDRVLLRYDASAATQCPEASEIARRVVERLGRDPFDPEADSGFAVTIAADGERLVARIATLADGSEGERELEAPGPACDALTERLVLALAIAIDPSAWLGEPAEDESEPAPEPEPETTTEVDDEVAPPVIESPLAPQPRWRAQLVVGGILGLGATPSPSGGARLGGELLFDAFSVALDADVGFSSAAIAEGSVDTVSASGAIAACGWIDPWFACGLVRAGALVAHGRDFDTSFDGAAPFFGIGARTGVQLVVSEPVFVRLVVEGWVPATRVRYRVAGEPVWQMEPIAASLGLELAFRTGPW